MRNLRTLGLRAVTLRSGVGRVDGDHPALLHDAQMVQDPILETPVRDGGPLAGRPVSAVPIDQTDHPIGVQKPVGEPSMSATARRPAPPAATASTT